MCNNILQYGHLYAWGREHKRLTVSMRFAYKYKYFKICHTRYHLFAVYAFAKYASKWGLIPVVKFNDDGADYSENERKMLNSKMIVAEGVKAIQAGENPRFIEEKLLLLIESKKRDPKANEAKADKKAKNLQTKKADA